MELFDSWTVVFLLGCKMIVKHYALCVLFACACPVGGQHSESNLKTLHNLGMFQGYAEAWVSTAAQMLHAAVMGL